MCETNPDFEGNIEYEGAFLDDNPRVFPLKDTGFIRLRRKAKVLRLGGIILYRRKLTFIEDS